VQSGIKKAVVPIFGIEAVLLMVYLAVSFGQALVEETRKRNNKLAAERAAASGAETDEKPEKSDKKKS
jgi:hypothetical protein